jgi:hypothetical protein
MQIRHHSLGGSTYQISYLLIVGLAGTAGQTGKQALQLVTDSRRDHINRTDKKVFVV